MEEEEAEGGGGLRLILSKSSVTEILIFRSHKFPPIIAPSSVYKPYTTHNFSIRSDEGLTLETSAFLISVRWSVGTIDSVAVAGKAGGWGGALRLKIYFCPFVVLVLRQLCYNQEPKMSRHFKSASLLMSKIKDRRSYRCIDPGQLFQVTYELLKGDSLM